LEWNINTQKAGVSISVSASAVSSSALFQKKIHVFIDQYLADVTVLKKNYCPIMNISSSCCQLFFPPGGEKRPRQAITARTNHFFASKIWQDSGMDRT
jgi:hypothetical protein